MMVSEMMFLRNMLEQYYSDVLFDGNKGVPSVKFAEDKEKLSSEIASLCGDIYMLGDMDDSTAEERKK